MVRSLSDECMPGFEIGVLDRNHDTIPMGVSADPSGFIVTLLVDDVEAVHAHASDAPNSGDDLANWKCTA
jgi:hypothetical protein